VLRGPFLYSQPASQELRAPFESGWSMASVRFPRLVPRSD
jgi:hypothetical protein